MFREIYEALDNFFAIARETRRNRDDINELRQQVNELILTTQRLVLEFEHSRRQETAQRENALLRLRNEMLQFKMQLPAAADTPPGNRPDTP